jgi:hypothetical protein
MQLSFTHHQKTNAARVLLVAALIALSLKSISAQVRSTPSRPAENPPTLAVSNNDLQLKTFQLFNVLRPIEVNEIEIAFRSFLNPFAKYEYVSSRNVFLIQAPADQLALAERIIRELDHPRPSYRLTFSITSIENGKRSEPRHYSVIAVDGQKTILRQGEKIRLGSTNEGKDIYSTVDAAINFDVTISGSEGHLVLVSRIDRSVPVGELSTAEKQNPILRQSVIDGASMPILGQTITLGTTESLTGNVHTEIQVKVEAVT